MKQIKLFLAVFLILLSMSVLAEEDTNRDPTPSEQFAGAASVIAGPFVVGSVMGKAVVGAALDLASDAVALVSGSNNPPQEESAAEPQNVNTNLPTQQVAADSAANSVPPDNSQNLGLDSGSEIGDALNGNTNTPSPTSPTTTTTAAQPTTAPTTNPPATEPTQEGIRVVGAPGLNDPTTSGSTPTNPTTAPPTTQVDSSEPTPQGITVAGYVGTNDPSATPEETTTISQPTTTNSPSLPVVSIPGSRVENTRAGRAARPVLIDDSVRNYIHSESINTAEIGGTDVSLRDGYTLIVQQGKDKTTETIGNLPSRSSVLGSNTITVYKDSQGNIVAYKQTIKADKKVLTLKEMNMGTVVVDGTPQLVKVERFYGGENLGVEQIRYTVIDENSRNLPQGSNSVIIDDEGEIISGNGDNPILQEVIKKYNYNRLYTAFQRGVGWSSISSLFCDGSCFGDWALKVDKIFHAAYLGEKYWTEALCKVASDIDANTNAIFSESPDSGIFVSGVITATRQTLESPQGTRYLYKVSFFFRNPEQSSERGESSSSRGTTARGTSSSQTLDKEEKELWNGIKDGARKIESSLASTSPRASGEDIGYNIVFSGERRVELFVENQVIEEGDEISVTQEDSIAAYSNYRYTKVCLTFPDEQPLDAFYQDVSEICADIKEVNAQPTTIAIEERSSRKVSGSIREI